MPLLLELICRDIVLFTSSFPCKALLTSFVSVYREEMSGVRIASAGLSGAEARRGRMMMVLERRCWRAGRELMRTLKLLHSRRTG